MPSRSGPITYDRLQTFKRLRKPGEAQLYTSANTESWPNFWSRLPQAAVADHQRVAVEQDRRGLRCIFSVNPEFPIAHAGMGMTLRDLERFGLTFTASGQSANEPAVPPAFFKALLEKSVPTCKPATSRLGSATPRISETASAARAAVERRRKLALPHSTLCCIAQ